MKESTIRGSRADGTNRPLMMLLACSAVVIIGSLGPWAKDGVITVDGTQTAGVATVILGALALLSGGVQYLRDERHWARIAVMGAMFLLAILIGGYVWQDLERVGDDAGVSLRNPSPAWGLYLVMAGGIVGLCLSVAQLRHK